MAPKTMTLREKYFTDMLPALQKELKIKNVWAVPRVRKVTINVGIGKLTGMGKDYSHVLDSITAIAGQKPVVSKAKVAISNFKLKQNQPVGISVTLRGKRMYDFLNKLVNVVFPRVRDFRGISTKSFDSKGNYTVAFKENSVFPEVSVEDLNKLHGLEVSIVSNAGSPEKGLKLLQIMGFPFQEKKSSKKTA